MSDFKFIRERHRKMEFFTFLDIIEIEVVR